MSETTDWMEGIRKAGEEYRQEQIENTRKFNEDSPPDMVAELPYHFQDEDKSPLITCGFWKSDSCISFAPKNKDGLFDPYKIEKLSIPLVRAIMELMKK